LKTLNLWYDTLQKPENIVVDILRSQTFMGYTHLLKSFSKEIQDQIDLAVKSALEDLKDKEQKQENK
jgi:predicted nucleotidyltransferase